MWSTMFVDYVSQSGHLQLTRAFTAGHEFVLDTKSFEIWAETHFGYIKKILYFLNANQMVTPFQTLDDSLNSQLKRGKKKKKKTKLNNSVDGCVMLNKRVEMITVAWSIPGWKFNHRQPNPAKSTTTMIAKPKIFTCIICRCRMKCKIGHLHNMQVTGSWKSQKNLVRPVRVPERN